MNLHPWTVACCSMAARARRVSATTAGVWAKEIQTAGDPRKVRAKEVLLLGWKSRQQIRLTLKRCKSG